MKLNKKSVVESKLFEFDTLVLFWTNKHEWNVIPFICWIEIRPEIMIGSKAQMNRFTKLKKSTLKMLIELLKNTWWLTIAYIVILDFRNEKQ